MSYDLEYELGTYRGRTYLIHLNADPDAQNPKDWSVSVYYRDADSTESIEIARVDNSHGSAHFHRFYRRDNPTEDVDWGFWTAAEKLSEPNNWRTYAESHDIK